MLVASFKGPGVHVVALFRARGSRFTCLDGFESLGIDVPAKIFASASVDGDVALWVDGRPESWIWAAGCVIIDTRRDRGIFNDGRDRRLGRHDFLVTCLNALLDKGSTMMI